MGDVVIVGKALLHGETLECHQRTSGSSLYDTPRRPHPCECRSLETLTPVTSHFLTQKVDGFNAIQTMSCNSVGSILHFLDKTLGCLKPPSTPMYLA